MARGVIALTAAAMLVVASAPVAAQNQTAAPPQTQGQSPPAQAPPKSVTLPVDIDRIRAIVEQTPRPAIDLSRLTARFYVRVEGKNEIHFSDFIGSFDLMNGPVPRAGQTHAEFLAMVTPKELYSAAGIKPAEELEMALTGFLGQALARKAINEIRKAATDREIQQIRDRITKELEALAGRK